MSTATTPKAQPQHRSVTLRVYQRIVPLRWRLAVRQTMPPGMKAAVARRLAYGGASRRLVEAVVGGLASLRHRRLLRNPEHCLVRAEGRFRVALVRPEASPTAARRETLDVVLRTLTAADLPFFCVRGYDDRRSVVAIDAVHRSAALDALAAACRDTPGYLARIVHDVTDLLDGLWPARRGATMVRRASVVRLVRFYCDPARLLVLGPEYGCDLEMWSKVDGMLVAPRPNRAADEVQPDGPTVLLDESAFVRTPLPGSTRTYPTRPECVGTLLDEITFPIDAVYTWVDGSDPHWRARRDAARGLADTGLHAQAANDSRFISRDELRFSMRSLNQYAPWINHIWLVTDDQVPRWLGDHPKVTVISHRQLFDGRGTLPTFNSHAIESQLHHIPGLAEHFLYLNDDMLLGRPLPADLFFHPNGLTKFFPSTAKLDAAPPDPADLPVMAAGKNNRRLVGELFGVRVTYKMKHCPQPLRRSLMLEIEQRFNAELAATAHHQFRHPGDVSLPSSLYHYYTHATGQATIGDVRYMYVNLADSHTQTALRLTLMRRDFDLFCLNDTDSEPASLEQQQRMVTEFLESYYPVPAPWERSERER